MKCIKVIKQENKYLIKMLDKIQDISMEAHESKQLQKEEMSNCIEFVQQYIIKYQRIKQEDILFKQVRNCLGEDVEPMIEKILYLYGIGESYFKQLKEAYNLYEQGKYLAIYNIINNAYTYQSVVRKSIQEEEIFYEYIGHKLSKEQKMAIDFHIACFHKQVQQEELKWCLQA